MMRLSAHSIVIGNFRTVQFFSALACIVALWLPVAAAGQTVGVRSTPHRLTIGIFALRSSPDDSLERSSSEGVTLGLEEAQRTGGLFGWEIVVVLPPDSLPISEAQRYLVAAAPTAIVGDLTRSPIMDQLAPAAPLFLDVGRAPKRPRGRCGDRAFRLLPSTRSAQPLTKARSEITSDHVGVVAWHPALERFGAAQLNERYRKRFGTDMDERAWAGWMSIKVLLDAALKTGTSNPCSLERFLLGEAGRFDGHKGTPLFFDPHTRELVQPLYAPQQSGEPEMVGISPSSDATSRVSGVAGTGCPSTCG